MGIPSGFAFRDKPAFPSITVKTEVDGKVVETTVRKGPIPVCRVDIIPSRTHGPRKFRVSKATGHWIVKAIMSFVDDKRPLTAEERRTGKRQEEDVTKMEDWEVWQKFGKPYTVLKTRQELIRFLSAFTTNVKEAITIAEFLKHKKGTAKLQVSTDKGETWKDDEDGKSYVYDESTGAKPWKYRMDWLRNLNADNDKFKVKLVTSE